MFKRIKKALFKFPTGFLLNIVEDLILDAIEEKILASKNKYDDYFALPLVRMIRHMLNGMSLDDASDRVFAEAADKDEDERVATEMVIGRVKEAVATDVA